MRQASPLQAGHTGAWGEGSVCGVWRESYGFGRGGEYTCIFKQPDIQLDMRSTIHGFDANSVFCKKDFMSRTNTQLREADLSPA